MHPADNVAIVANDGGLPAGTVFADGLRLLDKVPQGHKISLVDIAGGAAVRRYNVVIGTALRDIPAGSWVHERLLQMPQARSLIGLPMATEKPPPLSPSGASRTKCCRTFRMSMTWWDSSTVMVVVWRSTRPTR